MRSRRRSFKPIAEINLTSMMDLTFLLLITFIITFPLIEQGIPINLPTGKAQPQPVDDKPAVVSVRKDGLIYLGLEPLEMDVLEQRLRILYAENNDLRLTLRGDTEVHYGSIVNIARLASSIGIKKLSMITQE